jgi:ElaA protein
MDQVSWTYGHFNTLSAREVYDILCLRSKVFVVEQNCVYLDTDGKDANSFHLCGRMGDTLVAYARILPPGLAFPEASIGRVVTDPKWRGTGNGRMLMQMAIEKTLSQFTVSSIRIGAQTYLLKFYTSLGFKEQGDTYIEDGIPHIEMRYTK